MELQIDLGRLLQEIPYLKMLILFGSRAKGNYKVGSDVDLALKGESVTHSTVFQLADLLNETYPLPYFFDILDYNTNFRYVCYTSTLGEGDHKGSPLRPSMA